MDFVRVPRWSVRWSAIASVPLVLAAAAGSAGAQDAAAPDTAEAPTGPEVRAVRFPGADALDRATLADAIETEATQCKSPLFVVACWIGDWDWAEEKAYLDRSVLPEDEERLETLYEVWGYPDARAQAEVVPRDDGAVVVEFRVEEGRPIVVRSLEVRGLDTLTPPVDLPPLPLREGEPYALPRLEETQQLIRDTLAERGRPFAAVEVQGEVDDAARAADVVLAVDQGPAAVFGPVTVLAEAPIEEDVVRERVAVREGAPYRPSALEETERTLYRLPIVERAVAETLPVEEGDTIVPVRVRVGARRVQGLELEGTVSSTDCVALDVFWTHRYLLGEPRLFSLGVGVSNLLAAQVDGGFPCTSGGSDEFAKLDYMVQADLRQPWPGSPRTSLLLSAFLRRESVPRTYIQEGYGGRVGVARDLGGDWTVSALYEPERNRLRAAGLFFCGNFGVCSAEGIERLSSFTWLAPAQLIVARVPPAAFGRRSRPGERRPRGPPSDGPWRSWLRGGLEEAAAVTGSEFRYTRLVAEGALTRDIGGSLEVAGRSRVGALRGRSIVPPQVRLYSGGVNTVRGIEQNLLGPTVLVIDPEAARTEGCALRRGGCPPAVAVDPDAVDERPLGGDLLVEANVEGRVGLGPSLQLAAFMDIGALGRDVLTDTDAPFPTDRWVVLATPGVGARISTGIGPVRIDVGYDPRGARTLPLLTEAGPDGGVLFLGPVSYDPFGHDDPGPLTRFWRHLQLHVAIGQPF